MDGTFTQLNLNLLELRCQRMTYAAYGGTFSNMLHTAMLELLHFSISKIVT